MKNNISHDTEAQDPRSPRMRRLRTLSRWLDSAIPLPGGYRIGLDGLFGLIPGVGDPLGGAVSAYIIVEAAQLGASTLTLLRMVFNVLLDAVIGVIPLVGDLFDFAWKANLRNVALLERQIEQTPARSSPERRLTGVAIIMVVLLVAGVVAISWLAIKLLLVLFHALGSGN